MSTRADKENTKSIDKLCQVISTLTEHIDKELQLQQIRLFLFVAQEQQAKRKPSTNCIAESLNMPQGSVSRNTKVMGIWKDTKGVVRGMDVIKSEPDQFERRRLVYSLTEHGEDVLKRISDIVSSHN